MSIIDLLTVLISSLCYYRHVNPTPCLELFDVLADIAFRFSSERGFFIIQKPSHGTTLTPIDFACDMTLLHRPSKLRPVRRGSVDLIFAISKTCFSETVPITSVPGFCAPLSFPLCSLMPAACRSNHAVVGVRISKENDLSGRTVTRAGIGTPGVICAVRALNSLSFHQR